MSSHICIDFYLLCGWDATKWSSVWLLHNDERKSGTVSRNKLILSCVAFVGVFHAGHRNKTRTRIKSMATVLVCPSMTSWGRHCILTVMKSLLWLAKNQFVLYASCAIVFSFYGFSQTLWYHHNTRITGIYKNAFHLRAPHLLREVRERMGTGRLHQFLLQKLLRKEPSIANFLFILILFFSNFIFIN